MEQVHRTRKNQVRCGARRRRLQIVMEPELLYQVFALAKVKGISVAGLLADAATAQIQKARSN